MGDGEIPADKIARELGEAAGRKLAVMDAEEYIDERGLTNLERFELALSILDGLNYKAPMEWETVPSQHQEGDE